MHACVSFAWEIVRDSPMVNIVSQTMNKHNSLSSAEYVPKYARSVSNGFLCALETCLVNLELP